MDISRELLTELRKTKKEKDNECHYPMFVNDEFNKFNWDGGDDIPIRKFFNYCNQNKDRTVIHSCLNVFGNKGRYITYIIKIDDDYIFTIMILDSLCTYTFRFNTIRKDISEALYNGKNMSEINYIDILNHIESSTKFSFNTMEENK